MSLRSLYRPIVWVIIPLLFLLCSCYQEQVLEVKALFRIEVVNNNYAVPVLVKISNSTSGAESYVWTMSGAEPSFSSDRNPGTLQYNNPGTYIIHLEATNQNGGKDSRDKTITVDAAIRIGFTINNNASWYPDATVSINNKTIGATSYQWTFAGGTPASSTQQQPGKVIFSAPGTHIITLKASNSRVSYTKDTIVAVLPDLTNDFNISWAADDNDMEVPFTAYLQNSSLSATRSEWNCSGGLPSTSTATSPTVSYALPGTYTLRLTASNDKKSLTKTQTITLLPNSNLFRFSNVHLGVNTAQNTIGCYFSSSLGKALKASEVTDANGSSIDFVYFGFDYTFRYNKFISPNNVQSYTFSYIPNAITSNIINTQESCECGTSITIAQFDALVNDDLLQSTSINQTAAGQTEFNSTALPRIVLFQTQDGRKGVIKVKKCVAAGQQSYIECDIKVMKKP